MIAIIITVCVCLLLGITLKAQSKYKIDGKTIKKEASAQVEKEPDVLTEYTMEVKMQGIVYDLPVYITKNNACYVIRKTKRGSEYKSYLPKDIARKIAKSLGREVKEEEENGTV